MKLSNQALLTENDFMKARTIRTFDSSARKAYKSTWGQ